MHDRLTNVLAANAIATALSPNYAPGRNLIKGVFLDPAEHALRPGWEQTAANGVAGLRTRTTRAGRAGRRAVGERREVPRGVEPPRRQAAYRPGRALRASRVGPLDLHGDKLTIAGTDDLVCVVRQAEPGSPLTLLAELTPVR